MQFKTSTEQQDTQEIVNSQYINWDFFKNSTVLVTGATGLIGYQIILSLLYANEQLGTNINIIALARNKEKADLMFKNYSNNNLKFVYQTIEKPIKDEESVDFIIHTANTTSSKEMTEKPVETLNSIYTGTRNILEFAKDKGVKSLVYLSSMEVYGNIPLTRQEPLSEDDYGYIDIMKPRNSYPVGKKAAEAMCAAYFNEYSVPVKIARLAQTIGAGVDYNDGRVFAEFARCIVEKRDIVLKTKGDTVRSYIYITDAVTAILSMLEKGNNGESYNVANPETTCSIKEMAERLCKKYKTSSLSFNLENNKHFLGTIKYVMDISKLINDISFKPSIKMEEMFLRIIKNFTNRN